MGGPVREGMGAIVTGEGVGFRVWAPHADAVALVGDFNGWDAGADALASEGNGYCCLLYTSRCV